MTDYLCLRLKHLGDVMRTGPVKRCLMMLGIALSTAWGCGAGDKGTPELTDTTTDSSVDGVVEDGRGDQVVPDSSGGETKDVPTELDTVAPVAKVRLVQITDPSEGTGGPAAVAQAGDFVLENERVRFVIQGTGVPRSWVQYTGSLVDADLVRPDGESGKDVLNEVSPINGLVRAFCGETFDVVKDGSDGESALLRVTGTDCGIPVIDMILPVPPINKPFIMEYELTPGSNALKLTMKFTNEGAKRKVFMGDGVVWNRRARVLTPGFGWGTEGIPAGSDLNEQYAVAEGIAYGFISDKGPLDAPISDAEILPLMGYEGTLETGETAEYSRWFVVGKDLEEVRATLNQKRGVKTWPVTVHITLEDAQDADQPVDIWVLDGQDNIVAQRALPSDSVVFEMGDGAWSVMSRQEGRPDSEKVPVVVASEAAEVELVVPATGRVAYSISGDGFDYQPKAGLPCRVLLQAGADAAAAASPIRYDFTATGQGVFLMEPGEYTLIASRGYEYEYYKQNVTVEAGKTVQATGTLTRSVDTTGWVAGDMHMHSAKSIDTVVVPEMRVVEMAAAGLERGPNTDHDYVGSLDQEALEMGVGEWLRLTVGCEVSPPGYHTNGYPLVNDPTRTAYFGVHWYKGYNDLGKFLGAMTNPEIWAEMRSVFQAGIVQINHPRDGQGYLDLVEYDPTVGLDSVKEGYIDTNFDAIEVVNAGRVDLAMDSGIADYFSFQNQGLTVAAVGSSDSHGHMDPGDARTYIRTGVDDPRSIDDDAFSLAVKGQRTVCASGPFITLRVGQTEIGDTYQGTGPYTLEIRVQAPSWMPVDWVKVVVNGALVGEFEVTGTSAGLRFSKDLVIPDQGKDFWVLAYAGAPDKDMAPVSHGQKVFSFTSPIYVDFDSNGWTAPGIGAEASVVR